MSDIKISIITATYNAAAHLPRLIESLLAQTDQDFEWVVADGGSTDGTLELLEQAKPRFKRLIVDSRPDFGIYDALNRAIRMAGGDYYVVAGADDVLFVNAVADYKSACAASKADFVTARIEVNGSVVGKRKRPWQWLYGQFAHVSGHAVGLAIKRASHRRWGWYSRKLPIAADQLFILSSLKKGASVAEADFVAGSFDVRGTSGQDILGALVEGYRVQVMVGHSLWLQSVLLMLRVFKHRKAIILKQ